MFHKSSGLSAALAALIVLVIIIAATLSFSVGQNAIRLVTVTQTATDLSTLTTTQVSTSTVTVTTTPPDYFQVDGVLLYSGIASARTLEGTANLRFSVTGPLANTATVSATIIAIHISNSSSSTFPTIYQCTSTSSCTAVNGAVVKEYGVTNFNTSATAFYIGDKIISGQSYDYNIIFSNGNSVAGTVVAT